MKILSFSSTKFNRILWVFLVLGFCFGCQKNLLETGNAYEPESASSVLASAKTNYFMVITKSETLPAGFETQLSAYGKIVKSIPEIGVVVIKPTTSNFEMKIAKLVEVKAVVPDYSAKWIEPVKFINESNPPGIGSDEPLFSLQWGLDAIDAPEAWNGGYTGEKVKILNTCNITIYKGFIFLQCLETIISCTHSAT